MLNIPKEKKENRMYIKRKIKEYLNNGGKITKLKIQDNRIKDTTPPVCKGKQSCIK